MKICVKAFAKINLFLQITGLDGKGYHLIDSVMQSVSLCDEIEISETDGEEIKIECNRPSIPCDERNIAYKAARVYFDSVGFSKGIRIKINKVIPHEAGLGGGSADAAGVLTALNELFGTKLSQDRLCAIGKRVGADVPFCIVGGAARVQGIGEKLLKVPVMPPCRIVIAKPNFGVSTKQAYSDYDLLKEPKKLNIIDSVISSIEKRNLVSLGSSLANAFEQVVFDETAERIKEVMREYGALGCLMSGSGSAIFALFDEEPEAESCAADLKGICDSVHICEPCDRGVFLKTE